WEYQGVFVGADPVMLMMRSSSKRLALLDRVTGGHRVAWRLPGCCSARPDDRDPRATERLPACPRLTKIQNALRRARQGLGPTADGLTRISRNGNGNGYHNDLGYHPFVSIHVAAYNEKRVIERLLTCLDQLDYPEYEVVVVDDSTDESVQILEKWKGRPRFKIGHRNSRLGFKGGALREALKVMDPRTEYVVIFDADSMPFPDSIERFLPYFYAV